MNKKITSLIKIKDVFVNALFPRDIKCITCNAELNTETNYGLCGKCLTSLPFNNQKICYTCGDSIGGGSYCLSCKDNQREYEKARAPFLYQGKIKGLIYRLKYSSGKYLAPYISYLLLDEFIKQNWDVNMVVPVPLYKKREKRRGFNQASIISIKFNEVLGLPIEENNLVRVLHTPQQTKLTRKQRLKNLKGAFKVLDKKKFKNKNVLLVDDVYTTGATSEECAVALKKAGVKNVYVLTLAHVKKPTPTY